MCLLSCITYVNYSEITVLLRTASGVFILPLEHFCVVVLCMLFVNPFFLRRKVIPMRHPKTNEVARGSLHDFMHIPAHLIFNDIVKKEMLNVGKLFRLSSGFALLYVISSLEFSELSKFILTSIHRYPILCGIFFNSGVLVQSILVPVFFALRSWFEYSADAMTAKTFGTFFGFYLDLRFCY